MVLSQRPSQCRPTASVLAWAALLVTSLLAGRLASAQPTHDIRLSRYTTASTAPDAAQVDPLQAVVQIGFPRATVRTVGDAIAYLLVRTGYRLAHPQEADKRTPAVLDLPLPEVHRRLGPCTVRTALSVLLGKPFVLSTDPVQRLVSYRVEAATSELSATLPAGEAKAARVVGNGSVQ